LTTTKDRGGRLLFAATILTGSFLLFLVQPMIARIALPRLGGAPAVWNSAMLVYQALLLAGYGYAHLLTRLAPRRQGQVHLALLLGACLFLPIGLSDRVLPATADPALWVPYLFAVSIGPLFFAVSAQAPLMQRWFALVRPGTDPYPLYAASNLGSFAGLLAFPLLVEPLMTVTRQRWLWSGGYLLLVLLVLACMVRLPRGHVAAVETPSGPAPSRAQVAMWVLLGLVPSGMMLATSTFISTDLLAMPLLWVVPLALYLLSFSVAFASRRALADTLTRFAPLTILIFGGIMMGGFGATQWLSVVLALMLLFMASVALHTRLYRLRPEPARLTSFYLAMSTGGALGGVFAGLVAPVLFDWTWEYPILILAAGALTPQAYLTQGLRRWWQRPSVQLSVLLVGAAAIVALVAVTAGAPERISGTNYTLALSLIAGIGLVTLGARLPYLTVLLAALLLFGGIESLKLSFGSVARSRSYFGIYTILDESGRRLLVHGSTVHGLQLRGTEMRERTPTTYYTAQSGVGRVMREANTLFGRGARIGVVGLGTGTLACYKLPGQHWRFYEIDPEMVEIARHGGFTFLQRCAPDATVAVGDARLSLEREERRSLDILALDAFSSDAVPMHLLTREAFAVYGRALQPKGVLVVHISNRFIDLAPVVAAAARDGGWQAMALHHVPSILDRDESRSTWIAMSRDPHTSETIRRDGGDWRRLRGPRGFDGWSDDYASILPLLTF
jgi:SAM-dependent methyltransferase